MRVRDNKYVVNEKEGYCDIVIYNRYDEVRAICKIDIEDMDKCSKFDWRYDKRNGVVSSTGIYLTRYLMSDKLTPGLRLYVFHTNRNKLDNRKSNLEVISQRAMAFRFDNRSSRTTDVVGISYDKKIDKYYVQVHCTNVKTLEQAEYLNKVLREAKAKAYKELGI